jgi:hypothetical protein
MVQGDHFGETGSHSVLWDKVTAGAIPEPAATAFTAALAARGLASGPPLPGRLRRAARTFFSRVRTPADAGLSVGFHPIAHTGFLGYAVTQGPMGAAPRAASIPCDPSGRNLAAA